MNLIQKCQVLIQACNEGKLGPTIMPEDSSPVFSEDEKELRIAYFTLPTALNYQRDSFKLWESALKTYEDKETRIVFDVKKSSKLSTELLRQYLSRHKLALQPNKHVNTWQTISKTVFENWGDFRSFMNFVNQDFLILRETMQVKYKKQFPYLSGPKIFNYWSSILDRYAHTKLKNQAYIEMAVDTHVLKASVVLGVITQQEADKLGRLEVAERWRRALAESEITPSNMHFVLWFWSRNGFKDVNLW